jgi:hypothetical protein
MTRTRFCESSVSYNEARWLRMIGSFDSSATGSGTGARQYLNCADAMKVKDYRPSFHVLSAVSKSPSDRFS